MDTKLDFESWFEKEVKHQEEKEIKKQSRNFNDENRLNKIYSKWHGNWGNIWCLPICSEKLDPVTSIEGAMEVRLSVDGGDERNQKILPREFYSFQNGTPEAMLHGELCSLFSTLYELKGNNYSLANRVSYHLMYAWVLKHSNQKSENLALNKPSLLVMANNKFKVAWLDAVENYSQLVGNVNWASKFYSRDGKGKDLILHINIKRPDNYLFVVDHKEITTSMKGMTDNKDTVDIDQNIIDTMFTDPVNDLLGVDKVEDRFNYDWYVKVKEAMVKKIEQLRSSQTQPVSTPQPEVPQTPPMGEGIL